MCQFCDSCEHCPVTLGGTAVMRAHCAERAQQETDFQLSSPLQLEGTDLVALLLLLLLLLPLT